jgi:hypothetical protein
VALQSAVYKNNYEAFDVAYAGMKNVVWEKQIYSLEDSDVELEFSIHQLIEHLKRIYESARRSNIWHYPLEELSTLSNSFLQLEGCSMISSHYQDFHQQVKSGIVKNCLNTVYLSGLSNKIELIKSIEPTEANISNDFINYVLTLLQSKNKPILNDMQFALALREILNNPQDVEVALKQLGENRDISSVLNSWMTSLKEVKVGYFILRQDIVLAMVY